MIKIENTDVYGWEAAIRGMRNPMNSWDKGDSGPCPGAGSEQCGYMEKCEFSCCFDVGENDLKLMQNLSNAGNDHGKFLRMITVTADITAPLYWWKEFDTYKVGTVANSCSTMHKIQAKEFTLDDFSHEHLIDQENHEDVDCIAFWKECLGDVIQFLNWARIAYLKTNDKKYWWQMIQLLPSSYNQKRTVQINYQVAKAQRAGRRHHKLDEWHDYCDWLEGLPYFKEICLGEGHK